MQLVRVLYATRSAHTGRQFWLDKLLRMLSMKAKLLQPARPEFFKVTYRCTRRHKIARLIAISYMTLICIELFGSNQVIIGNR